MREESTENKEHNRDEIHYVTRRDERRKRREQGTNQRTDTVI